MFQYPHLPVFEMKEERLFIIAYTHNKKYYMFIKYAKIHKELKFT